MTNFFGMQKPVAMHSLTTWTLPGGSGSGSGVRASIFGGGQLTLAEDQLEMVSRFLLSNRYHINLLNNDPLIKHRENGLLKRFVMCKERNT